MFQKIGLQVYRTPQPDVVRVPFGMDDSSRRALRAEPRRPLFPSRIVEAWLEPPLPASLSSISPKDGLRQHGRLGQRRYISNRPSFTSVMIFGFILISAR